MTADIIEDRYTAMVTVWARPEAHDAVGAVLGVPLPRTPGTVGRGEDRVVVWVGPQEWLILDRTAPGDTLTALLAAPLSDGAGAAVDVSSHRVALRLRGTGAADVLASGCAIDLHPRFFGRDSTAATGLALANVILIAEADDATDFTVLVRTTFRRYLDDWLADAVGGENRTPSSTASTP